MDKVRDKNGLLFHMTNGKKQIWKKDFIKYFQDIGSDCYIGLDFISNSLYDDEDRKELDKKVEDAYNKGRMERAYDESKEKTILNMMGLKKDYTEIYNELLKIKKAIFYSGYGLQDAPFHGWSGEEMRKIYNTTDDIEHKIEDAIELVQIALGTELDKDAWRKVD